MPISQLVDLNTLNSFYEQVKTQVEDRVAKTTYDKEETLGTQELPYKEAYIDNIHGDTENARHILDSKDSVTPLTASTLKGNLDKGASTQVAMWDSNEIRTLDAKDMPVSDDSYDMVFKENFKTQKSNSPLVIDDSVEYPLKDMTIFGKTEQFSTEGNQLYNSAEYVNNERLTKDGSTETQAGYWCSGFIPVKRGKTYSFSLTGFNVLHCVYNASKGFVKSFTETSIAIEDDGFVRLTGTWSVKNPRDIMFNEGGSVESFEPYTGGKASPNPDYPQPIITSGASGSIETNVGGGNLFVPTSEIFENTTQNILIQDGLIKLTIPSAYAPCRLYIKVPSSSYITIEADFVSEYGVAEMSSYNIGGSRINSRIHSRMLKSTFFTNEHTVLTLSLYASEPGEFICTNFRIHLGKESIPYEPYKPLQTLVSATPNGLNGSYNADTSQYIQDKIDYQSGKKSLDLFRYKFTGNEPIGLGITGGHPRFSIRMQNAPKAKYSGGVACTHFEVLRFPLGSNERDLCITAFKNDDSVYLRFDAMKTVDDLKSWLKTANMEIVYYSEPVITDIPQEEMEAYKALHTNNLVTTIWNDGGTEIETTYLSKHGANLSSRTFDLETETENLGARATDLETETDSLGSRADVLEATKIHYSYAVDASYEAL